MGLLTPLAVRIGALPWMPKLLPQIVWSDKTLQRLTRGRVSVLDIAGLPNLTFTVRGRKSGVERSTPLLCVPDGDTILIAGSYFGGPTMPLWVHNLRAADGAARVGYGGQRFPVHATELEGEARARAWAHMLETWPNFATYEERTDRLIPVFRLARTS
ncbi:nitroreductase family deazaflavin-dependent oxidoreductase [Nocardioides anomalus]|uniref:Nitroreductase family deazaflavin-dependent oxidoreductase n=1 Tax=Nocardioides anomalus TaxID=2712223 RepID=A0A6G6WKB5_9ACTN|nr:nitroreductase family deazaflavin-dependent oxidoreductase [Nocardioides anomalus]QIG45652.1 nitroreductase family deazaflavin-dependent oxidoreductase [Nocardioides anomalus]